VLIVLISSLIGERIQKRLRILFSIGGRAVGKREMMDDGDD
jgi:hypothetical protein